MRWGLFVVLGAVLAAGGTVAAEGSDPSREVPGLGHFAGPTVCRDHYIGALTGQGHPDRVVVRWQETVDVFGKRVVDGAQREVTYDLPGDAAAVLKWREAGNYVGATYCWNGS